MLRRGLKRRLVTYWAKGRASQPTTQRNNPMKYRARRLAHTPLKTGQQIREGRALLGLDHAASRARIGRIEAPLARAARELLRRPTPKPNSAAVASTRQRPR